MALLDDVGAIAKVAAASLDDVAGQAAKAGVKAAGVVIDDAAVTPRYVTGFAAKRELPKLDEKLYLEVFAPPTSVQSTVRRTGRSR
jgi:predicted DNA repair protein MutK